MDPARTKRNRERFEAEQRRMQQQARSLTQQQPQPQSVQDKRLKVLGLSVDKFTSDPANSKLSALQLTRKYRETQPKDRKGIVSDDDVDMEDDEHKCLKDTRCVAGCMTDCADIALMPCGHLMCRNCFNKWLRPFTPRRGLFGGKTTYVHTPLPLQGTIIPRVATLDLDRRHETPELIKLIRTTVIDGQKQQEPFGIAVPKCPKCMTLIRGYMQIFFS